MKTSALATLLLVATCGLFAQAPARNLTDSTRLRALTYGVPLHRCFLGTLLAQIGFQADIPIGFEEAPDGCGNRPGADVAGERREDLSGLTVQDAMTRIFIDDPIYEWRDVSGVIIVRPKAAWNNQLELLNQSVDAFTTSNSQLEAALASISNTAALPGFYSSLPPSALPAGILGFTSGSVADALTAIIRARRDVGWHAFYCGDDLMKPESVRIELSIRVEHFGKRVGIVPMTDALGRRVTCG